jgi:osmoprotectant transport system substrate-binding protein
MRHPRMAALGASWLVLALLVGACSTGGGGGTGSASPGASSPAAQSSEPAASESAEGSASDAPSEGGATLASTLVLGGPPECPQRPFCALGLKDKYGLEFKEFKPLDVGGPITVAALESGEVQVGLLFTSDPNIAAKDFVLLEDDKGLQNADNIIPVIRQEKLDAAPRLDETINDWMAKLTQEELIGLNQAVAIDQEDPADVVTAWMEENGPVEVADEYPDESIVVGSFNFPESEILGELLAQIAEASGMTVERKFNLGNREIVMPALESGEIDLIAEYGATALEFVNGGAGEATPDIGTTADLLNQALQEKGLAALGYAPATDQNGFVVTRETGDQYGLAKLSDLAKPAQ